MANEKYFAITVGPKPGIYFDVYDNIKSMVNGVKNSKNPYKGFKTYLEAEKWMKGLGFPELCVFRSLTEETREEYCSTDIAENDELPWDVVTDSKCNSPQLQQETQEKKDFISNDSVLQFSKIDYWSLENALDSKQKRIKR